MVPGHSAVPLGRQRLIRLLGSLASHVGGVTLCMRTLASHRRRGVRKIDTTILIELRKDIAGIQNFRKRERFLFCHDLWSGAYVAIHSAQEAVSHM
jgi:hypothetical protein